MKPINDLSKDEMWEATVSCDSAYDGLFFYAVQTTGIFCRPSCKSKVPNGDNVSFFSNAREAQETGYRPCKRCRPDLNSIITYDPPQSVIEKTMQFIEDNYHQPVRLDELASTVGVSRFHLNRLFKARSGYTPRLYLEKVRIEQAQKLLLTTAFNSTEIGYQVGFQSISSFYHAFRRAAGTSPKRFQARHIKSATYRH